VDIRAAKPAIKSEVLKTYKVNVVSIKTLKVKGQKKAIVTLKEGQKLDIYEEKKKKKEKKNN
jgi:ribosomal protein L23